MVNYNFNSMEKAELYTYKDDQSTLQFQIQIGPESRAKKKSFLAHLKNAVADLTFELEQDPKE